MIEKIKNIKSDKSDLRKFGIIIGVIFLIIAGVLFWNEKRLFQLFLGMGVVLFFTAIAIPVIIKPVYWIWMVFATVIGWFMTRVILCLLFYTLFMPIGLIARLFGKEFLDLNLNYSKDSYWINKTANTIRKNYEKQF